VLPDGKTVIYTLAKALTETTPASIRQFDTAQIVAQAIGATDRKILIERGADARYVATGHLVYALGGVLFSAAFDAQRLVVTTGAVPVLVGVSRTGTTGAAQFSVSSNGTLVYISGPAVTSAVQAQLSLFDRVTGAATPLKLPPGPFEHPRVSPDGKQITYGLDNGKDANVWVYDLDDTSQPRPLTFGGRNKFPMWSGDSQHIVFQSDREGDQGLFWQRADGKENARRLTRAEAGAAHIPNSWLPKGNVLLYSEVRSTTTLWTVSVPDGKPVRFDDVESVVPTNAVFSPDGHWVAYTSGDAVGTGVLYVLPFPPTGTPHLVSVGIGSVEVGRPNQGLQALWSPDGKEIFFNPAAGQYVRASVSTEPTFKVGVAAPAPRPFLSGGPTTIRNNDMTPKGQILGIAGSVQTANGAPIVPQLQVVMNWFDELKARVPTK
jgi:hypothetical protein